MLTLRRFPIRYKFLTVLIALQIAGLSIFCLVAFRTFVQDKKQFVMELNLATLDAANSRVVLELSRRLTELEIFLPVIYQEVLSGRKNKDFPAGVERLPDEVVAVHFFSPDPDTKFEALGEYRNLRLAEARGIQDAQFETLQNLEGEGLSKVKLGSFIFKNRSLPAADRQKGLPIVTLLMRVQAKAGQEKEVLVAVDLLQEFLVQALQRSDVASVFLITTDGELISHSSLEETIANAGHPYKHPIVAVASTNRVKESLELKVGNENFLCSIGDTHFGNLSIVSQVSEKQTLYALKLLLRYCILLALGVLYVSFIVSVFFSRRLTSNIAKLERAANEVGSGKLDVVVGIHSKDEIQSVGETLEKMAHQVSNLLTQTAEKARMENELKMASLLQATLLSPKGVSFPGMEIETFYRPAVECGGDFWDMAVRGDKLTVWIGDATGHGASAAIVTSLAKGCFCTMNCLPESVEITPADYLAQLNATLFQAAGGELGMTMCVFQIALGENSFTLSGAGHEFPLFVSAHPNEEKKKAGEAEPLYVRGERLGFFAESEYKNHTYAIQPGDSLFLFTDGLIETADEKGKSWGIRSLNKNLMSAKGMTLKESRNQIVEAFQAHLGKGALADDITFVMIRKSLVSAKSKVA